VSTEELDTSDLRAYRLQARKWLAANMTPLARAGDGTFIRVDDSDPAARFEWARAMQAKLYDGGFAGITYPVRYGGAGLSQEHERVFLEEALPYDMPTAELSVSLNILGMTLLEFGTEEQKDRHLERMLRGEEIWLQLLSEPSGGSDLAGLITSARCDGDTYVLNGQKTWSTGAEFADFALCPARTDWDVPKHRGISMFIVDLNAPGIEIRSIKQINGGTDFCEEFLTDVVVPVSSLVGPENDGWRITRGMLAIEHEWVGRSGGNRPRPAGVADLISLARRRGLQDDAGVRRTIASIHSLQSVHFALTQRVGRGRALGVLHPSYGGVLKLSNDVMRQRRNEVALELAGSRGVAWEPGSTDGTIVPVYLQSRSATIAGGSSEIQRNNISEGALGLPREVSLDRDLPFRQVPKN